jgi:hypothetical protein
MHTLIDRALAREGLTALLELRLAGTLDAAARASLAARLDAIDVLLLGAMADRVRARDRGDVVQLHLDRPADLGAPGVVEFGAAEAKLSGQQLTREVARARLLGVAGLTIRMDVPALGLTRAQLGLPFGADALIAPLGELGFAVFDDEGEADGQRRIEDLLRERELASVIVGAGRTPRVVEWKRGAPVERDVDTQTEARRRFRAPGREEAELRARRERLVTLGKAPSAEAPQTRGTTEGEAR